MTNKHVIEILDDTTSLVTERAEAQARQLQSVDWKAQARKWLADRLKPERSGIGVAALEAGAAETQAKVEQIARGLIGEMQQQGLAGRGPVIHDHAADDLLRYLMDWQFGAGPLEPLFREPDVEDIIVNSVLVPGGVGIEVWTYRQSGKRRESVQISADEVREIVNRNAGAQGRALNASTPILNAQMRYGAGAGSRICAVMDPVCDPYLSVTIRIHRLVARSFEDLVALGTLTPAAANWLRVCVQAGLSIVVAGGTSSGKTNFLNAIARLMPEYLRVVVIEDTRELDLAVSDKVYWTTVQHPEPARCITQRDLVKAALRARPDRIVLGEVRDGAAWDAIKATNTGHQGTLLSLHAEDAESVLLRLAQLCSEASETHNLSEKTLKEVIASAFQIVVFLERQRMPDGSYRRLVTQINEVNGLVSDGVINQKQLFRMEGGQLVWTKAWPHERVRRRLGEANVSENTLHNIFNRDHLRTF